MGFEGEGEGSAVCEELVLDALREQIEQVRLGLAG